MPLQYSLNLIDHDRWISTGYKREFSWGLVLDAKSKRLGYWRVAEYDPNDDLKGGCYEFSIEKSGPAIVSEEFAFLDSQINRGLALSNFVAKISNWLNEKKI